MGAEEGDRVQLTGGLIQMNMHMQRQNIADLLIILGIFGGLAFLMVACIVWKGHKVEACVFILLAIAGLYIAVIGARMPKERIIKACASGPVSLEEVAAVYEILHVDGKELTLRERQ